MEFRLLGPMELVRDGDLLTFTAHKPRVLLAMLLVEAGRPAPWSRLLDELWHDAPPHSAMANLRTYAAQLRQLVFGGEPDRIRADPSGYWLALRDDQVDIGEFESRYAEGRQARIDGDPVAALAAYDDARRLWRGRPFAGLHVGPWLGAFAVALEERYSILVEDCLEIRLGLVSRRDEYAELVTELRAYVAEQPLREPAWRLLMLALYRLGDPGGALAAYAQARMVFREALGLDPCAELRDLQQAVLRRDRMLDQQAPPTPATECLPARQEPQTLPQLRSSSAQDSHRPTALQVAVCGSGDGSSSERKVAAELGRLLAAHGAVVVCGPDGAGAEAAAAARAEGGTAVETHDTAVPCADAVIGVGDSWEALSQVAMARRHDSVPVVLLGGWSVVDRCGVPVKGVRSADLPEEAVRYIFGDSS